MTDTILDQAVGPNWAAYHGDCVHGLSQLPSNSVDLSVYSPPFAQLYIYSESAADMGNTANMAEFMRQYSHAIRQLHRVTRPGRLSAVHCKQLVRYQNRDGVAGWTDFRGAIIRAHERAGWTYHCEAVIWKCPVTEMQRTKTHRLLYKTLRENASHTGTGMAEYLLVFRKWPKGEAEAALEVPIRHEPSAFPLDWWQEAASPVWMNIRQTRVLNVEVAREDQDEKHLCPLQLDVIERAVALWSNPGEVVLSPFGGIGSEGVVALRMKRRAVLFELKRRYWELACRHLAQAEAEVLMPSLLDGLPAGEVA